MTCVQEMVNKYHLTEFEHEKLNVKQPFYIIMTMRQMKNVSYYAM